MNLPNDKRSMIFGGSASVNDPDVVSFIKSHAFYDDIWNDSITRQYCDIYRSWIQSTKLNALQGLEKFPYSVYSNGTTQSFDMFYIKNKERRFRCFKGEYVYHKLAWRNNWPDWTFIDDDDIDLNDAVVVSLPFSDTGNEHQLLKTVLKRCEEKRVPVLIDCVYFGCCANIDFDFTSEAITDVTFSLSKSFPVAHARIGIRFSKVDDDDLMFVYDKFNYTNRIGAGLGIKLMQQFDSDYIYKKYQQKQEYCCKLLDTKISDTVYFAVDAKNVFPQYNRGADTNRLSLHRILTYTEEEIGHIINENSNS